MNKGNLSNFIKGKTTNRVPKLATLTVATLVLVSLVNIDASASPNSFNRALTTAQGSPSSAVALFGESVALGRHHNPSPGGGGGGASTTTTTDPAPATTTTDPAPATTTTDPAPATTTTDPAPTTTTTNPASAGTPWPIGVLDNSEVSGYAPPATNAVSGYSQFQVVDFSNLSALPSGWDAYSGEPGGDPGAQFGSAHSVVGDGMLSLNTWQDPAYGGEWVTGGVCDCGVAPTYGAFFVRSRVTGAGPTNVELLWPQSNDWPPEIDFNETYGSATATSATVHWGADNSQYGVNLNGIDMTQWHTWGVIWTPTSITYTVDGEVWATVSSSDAQIPSVPMHLALQQQTWCGASPAWACPTAPESMQINWVAVYTPNS